MASQLILDKKDPGIAEEVKNWVIGETYKKEIEFVFDKDGPTQASNTVTNMAPIADEAVLDDSTPPAKPPPAKAAAVPITYRK